ncbi:MAG: MBL fold metallo-hydrolase [Clostridiales bacterium]|nr:MBL fold metallo-hydrolase [Clostridiales bacterium]
MAKEFPYEIKQIAPGIHLINESFSTMFVVQGDTRALIIDCGTGTGDFKSVIESITSLPYDLVATHAHVDHIGGRGQFSDIFISAADAAKIKSVTPAYRRIYAVSNKLTGMNKVPLSSVNFTPVKLEPTVHIIGDGYRFDLGGRVLEVLETPGHTCGSLCLLSKSDGIIFTGDVANEFLFMWMSNCTTVEAVLPTLDRLLSTDGYETVWASHTTEPMTREDIVKCRECVAALSKRKNSVLPFIKMFKQGDSVIIYRATHIH